MLQPRPTLRLRSATSPPNADLVGRIAARDEQGLTSLYQACSTRVFGLALRIVGDRHAAEEVVVDTFAQVWERAAGYHEGKGSVLAWVLNIARSRALDRRRRLGVARTGEGEIADLAAAVLAREAGPDAATAQAERERAVRAAAAALPRGQREALAAAFFAGLTHVEIAAALQVPLGTVKSRIRDGLLALRRALAGTVEELP
jgi:RNA polymerase sigma-70 factor (ECF subfamily)